MKRSQILLAGLGALLLVALAWVLLYQPQRESIAEVEASIELEQDAQAALEAEIASLRAVRDEAPELEAELIGAEAIIPAEAALPAALRQLQLAADESGLELSSVTAARPAPAPDTGLADLAELSFTLELVGEYFPLVDMLRRIEDPAITPRGVEWRTVAVSRSDYPELTVSLTGVFYSVSDQPLTDEPAPAADTPTDETPEGESDGTQTETTDDGTDEEQP